MTSKNSFLTNMKENHKRRVWVWIISILIQIVLYPGIMTVYLSRIKFWQKDGAYATVDLFQKAMQDAVTDALGFHVQSVVLIALLGIVIAVQGFSYLYDRKKVDMYYSVPVSAKKRFTIIYTNGLLIYLIPALFGMLTALLIAAVQGSVSGGCLAECGLAFLLNLIYFLVVYHTSILAVMLTGNMIITGFAVATLLGIGFVAEELANVLKYTFFDTADGLSIQDSRPVELSVVYEYVRNVTTLKRMTKLSDIVVSVLGLYARWFIVALVLFALLYLCYKKRPAEAAGKAIAFPAIQPFLKVIISVLAGILVCYMVYSSTYYNVAVSVLCMIGGTVICCGVMEAIYEFDIRAVVKHLVSTGVSIVAVGLIFSIYYFDIFGYDSYIPNADNVESIALDLGPYQYYWEYFEEDGGKTGVSYVHESTYRRQNMFLTDIDAVCQLAKKGQGLDSEEMEDCRMASVLYRLKSGRKVCRKFPVDLADASNEELLNRIIGTREYKEGVYQIMKDEALFTSLRGELRISYSNGTIECDLPVSDMTVLREAWLKDMELYDFSLVRNKKLCGVLLLSLKTSYLTSELPVYEDFVNTIAFLKERNAYYPVELRAEDIASLEVVNHHRDEQEITFVSLDGPAASEARGGVSKASFEDPAEIAEIIKGIYPSGLNLYWNAVDAVDGNYIVTISFKANTGYPYGMEYYTYQFVNGGIPDFVAERTAYTTEEQ